MNNENSAPPGNETICALATPPGRSGIAVLRCSGPGVPAQACRLVGPGLEPRRASLRAIRDPMTAEVVDRGLVIVFRQPDSFTGEDMIEFQVHGSRAVAADLLDILVEQCGMRIAEPGEFTRRALENGKIDITRIEAMADLIDAETTAQRRQAIRNLDGALHSVIDDWRDELLKALARVEASFDFSDEGDIADDIFDAAVSIVTSLVARMERILDDDNVGERIRDGLTVVITGAPNAGKSTLLNQLSKRDIAIVSDIPGTTRDVLEVSLNVGGLPVTLVDTAGLRDSGDAIEMEGVRRAMARISDADLVLNVIDASERSDTNHQGLESFTQVSEDRIWTVFNKIDLIGTNGEPAQSTSFPTLSVSARTGEGMDVFLQRLGAFVAETADPDKSAVITRKRHRQTIMDARAALEDFLDDRFAPLDARTLHLHDAMKALGRLTGAVHAEDILDSIFSSFCIGK